MECGIFDFYKVFSRAFGEGEDGGRGELNRRWGMSSPTTYWKQEAAGLMLKNSSGLYL
jgi:hypothetical protein